MALVKNNTTGPIGMSPDFVVDEKSSLELPDSVLAGLEILPSVAAHFEAGRLEVVERTVADDQKEPANPADGQKEPAKK